VAWYRFTASTALLIAVVLPLTARREAGPSGAVVHVRWGSEVPPETRDRLEARFHLADRQQLDETTWRYVLRDPSRGNIRALIADPTVEDTHHIDRGRATLDRSAVRTPRPGRLLVNGDLAVRIADGLGALFGAIGILALVVGISNRARTARSAAILVGHWVRRGATRVFTACALPLRWLTRGIPKLDARSAGVFRAVFGAAVVIFFASHPEDMLSLTYGFQPLIYSDSHGAVLEWLRSHPRVVDALTPWLLMTAASFTVGFFTRLSYALFVTGALVWAAIAVTHDSVHPNSTLVLTLVALLPSRWGDDFSVDRWLLPGARRRPHVSDTRYGYAVWVPGLVFGIAFAAAAWAKLDRSGIDWILNGSIKYHFITDSLNAPVQWGLQVAGHPWVAIAASLGALLVELLVVTAAFARSERYRLAMGAAGLALLAGFWVFMGVFWPAWWILLLGFVPWQHLSRLHERSISVERTSGNATMAQLAAIVFVVVQQIVVSGLRIERAPMFTNYPMYSGTFASPAAFDAAMVPYYRIVVATDAGPVELACNATEDLVEQFRAALDGSKEATDSVWAAVRGCRRDLEGARSVALEGDRRKFDWDRLTFLTERAAIVVGPLPVRLH
jgi:hypothetical protein